MQKLIVIVSLVILTNCAYRPVKNPETSTNPKNYYNAFVFNEL